MEPGSLSIDHNNPTFRITNRRNYFIEGEPVHKVGRTSGWTWGGVTETCSDYPDWDTGVVMRCNATAMYYSAGGDSGSPVFSLHENGQTVTLLGIHWGGVPGWLFPPDRGIISGLKQIEKDLGQLIVYDPGPPQVTIDGPYFLRPNLYCTWTAAITNGIAPFDVQWSGIFTGDGPEISRVAQSSGWLHVQVTDWSGRQVSSTEYITVDPSGPDPPGCSE